MLKWFMRKYRLQLEEELVGGCLSESLTGQHATSRKRKCDVRLKEKVKKKGRAQNWELKLRDPFVKAN